MDEIAVFAGSVEYQFERLDSVFKRLKEHGLRFEVTSVSFSKRRLSILESLFRLRVFRQVQKRFLLSKISLKLKVLRI